MRTIIGILIGLMGCGLASAQVQKDSVKIYFHQGKHILEPAFKSNQQMLDKIDRLVFKLEKVEVIGAASPEGSVQLNERLSQKRAQELFNYLSRYGNLPDSLKTTRFIGRDWRGLLRLVEADPNVPYQQEAVRLISSIIREVESGVPGRVDPFWRLVSLRKGKPYRYMYYRLFPELRTSEIHFWFEQSPRLLQPLQLLPPLQPWYTPDVLERIPVSARAKTPSYHWAIKTNALYDLLLVPNIGVEFCFGKNWSVGANWMYAWWSNRGKNNFWRIYGGDVEVRRWFGKKAAEKPLQGHHLGVYGQLLTYDFETGGRGYMADKWNYTFGVSYGYSLPIAKRLNLDFTLGIGYWGGRYKEYLPVEGHYVWQSTKNRRWFGPTKAEVSLVWLLGHGNENKQKGGRQ